MEGHTQAYGTIGWAIKNMLNGTHMRRRAWVNIQWAAYVPKGAVQMPQKFTKGNDHGPFLVALTKEGTVMAWLASQADLLGTDWEIVSEGAKPNEPTLQTSAA